MPAILLCLLASGSASLALEVVWSRSLVLVFGSSSLAVTTTLVATMLGFGLGGLAGGRLADRVGNGVRAYGWMELGVAAYAALLPLWMRGVPTLESALVGGLGPEAAPFARFAIAVALLLLPTMAMGATLPLLVTALTRDAGVVGARTGLLYGINTSGAVLGVLGATFVGFPLLGLSGTNWAAVALDALAGGTALLVLAPRLERRADFSAAPAPTPHETATAQHRGARSLVLVAYAFVGAAALSFEVGWTRALAMVVGSSTYAFATMLAGFLAGIALGSLLVHRVLDRLQRPLQSLALGVACLGLAAWAVTASLDRLPDLFLAVFARVGISGANLVRLGFVVSFLVLLAPTLVLGALFPLCVRTLTHLGASQGRAVGGTYFVNTIGSAAGAFAMGFLWIPALGLGRALGVVIAACFVVAGALWLLAARGSARRGPSVALGALAVLCALFVALRPPAWDVDALTEGVYYRASSRLDFGLPEIHLPGIAEEELLFYEEGRNATVSVYRPAGGRSEGGISLRINGKTDASLADMSTQLLSGHVPMLFGTPAERVLVIGLASGVTTGAVTLHDPERVDVCEIEEAIVEASHFFDEVNHRPLQDPRVHLHLEDGRSFLRSSEETWDVLISEPSNPWMAGCANLFTREFFQLARARLAPGGRLLQWVQLYGMDPEGLRAILAALHESFPVVQGFLYDEESNDLLLLASDTPLTAELLPRLEHLEPTIQDDLARVRVLSTADLWSLLALSPADLADLAAQAKVVNTDDNLFVELRAPLRLYDDTPETAALLRESAGGVERMPGVPESTDDELLTELAIAYLERRGAADTARRLHERTRARGDEAGDALFRALASMLTGGSPGEIGDLLNTAVQLGPERFQARYQRAWFANQRRLYEPALRDLDRALALRPRHLEAAHQRSKALATLGQIDAALEATNRLASSALVETEPRLLAEAALLEANSGDFDRACARLREYLELEPLAPREWGLLADWEGRLGRTEAAAEALAQAARAQAALVRDFHWIARWHEHYGTREEALSALAVARSMAPENEAVAADIERLRALAAEAP